MTEIDIPRVGLGRVGAEAQILDRSFELRTCRQHHRRAHLGNRDVAQFLNVIAHRLLQLPDATGPKRDVRRPVGPIERLAGRTDSGTHVGRVRVGRDAKHFSVAGLTFGNVPPLPATSLPSMNSRLSRSSSNAIPSSHSHSGQLSDSFQSNHNLNSAGVARVGSLAEVEDCHF